MKDLEKYIAKCEANAVPDERINTTDITELTMKNTVVYKGFTGSIEFSETDKLFYGKVQGIKHLISYEGSNTAELIKDFHLAVDGYLETYK